MFSVLAWPALLPLAASAQEAVAEPAPPPALAVEETALDGVEPVLAGGSELARPEAPVTPPTAILPRLTPVLIELLATLSSESSTTGDHFPIRLAEAVVVDGQTVIPAGTMGEGEVIHAKRKGGMGAAGELIITARYLDLGGQRIALRSLRVNGDGQSRIDTVNGVAVASAATFPLVSLVGFFITGGALTVNEGTIAAARTAEEVTLPLATPAEPGAAGAPAAPQPAAELGDPPNSTSAADLTRDQVATLEGHQE